MKEQYERQVALLIDVLPFVAQAEVFALKGGTAINFFHLDCPRLSVDIDLHYLPLNDRVQALADIETHMQAIGKGIKQAYGDARVSFDGKTSKAVVTRRRTQIKIEPNKDMRGELLPVEHRRLSPSLEEKYGRCVSMPCVAKYELYAGKLCAALQRQHPRDLFDMLLFLRENDLTAEFMDVFLVYLISQRKPIYEMLNPNNQDIEAVYHKQFVGMSTKEIPLEDLLGVQERLPGLVRAALSEKQRQFLLGFKRGKPDWSLLPFNGTEDLPSLRRKQDNLDNMDDAKRQEAITRLQQLFAMYPYNPEHIMMYPYNPEHIIMTSEEDASSKKTPQEQMAEEIATELAASGLIDAGRQQQTSQKIAAGQLKPEDWSLLVEVAHKPDDKESDNEGSAND